MQTGAGGTGLASADPAMLQSAATELDGRRKPAPIRTRPSSRVVAAPVVDLISCGGET